jgi:hypothetical protein
MSAPAGLVQPVPLRFLLDDTLREARRSFGAIYPAVALPMGVAAALLGAAQRFVQVLPGGPARAPMLPGLDGFLAFGASLVAFLAVYSVCYMALLTAAADAYHGRGVRMARSWAFVFRPAVIGTVVLGLGVAALGGMCCFLPGIYVSLVFGLAGPVMIEEGRFGTAALSRSASLMGWNPRGRFGADPRVKMFLLVFAGLLLSYAANLLVQLPIIAVQQAILFRDIANGRQPDPAAFVQRFFWIQVLAQFLGALVNTGINVFVAFGVTLLFVDLRARKEAPDLEAAIGALAAAPPAAVP